MARYILPCSVSFRCLDRFDILSAAADTILEDEDGLVPFWPVLETVLRRPIADIGSVIDCLGDISATLRGSEQDCTTLRRVLESRPDDDFCTDLWPKITMLALRMPSYFPRASLSILAPDEKLFLSRGQAACLVAHQFLCSLGAPIGRNEYFDFGIWYGEEQRHPKAAEMYITAVTTFLRDLPSWEVLDDGIINEAEATRDGDVITYALYRATPYLELDLLNSLDRMAFSKLKIVHVASHSTQPQEPDFQGPHGAVVVSANKVIGFGESATQEEVYMGNAPEACPAVLFTPTLQTDHVLSITGAQPILRISGERREVTWEVRPKTVSDDEATGGTMLLMDALEFDNVEACECLPDLKADNIRRELRKAAVAFMSRPSLRTVTSPLWGCGAFGGDPAVKMAILWMAASVAGVELNILCEARREDVGRAFEALAELVEASGRPVEELARCLRSVPPTLRGVEILENVRRHYEEI